MNEVHDTLQRLANVSSVETAEGIRKSLLKIAILREAVVKISKISEEPKSSRIAIEILEEIK